MSPTSSPIRLPLAAAAVLAMTLVVALALMGLPALASHDGNIQQACPKERVPEDGFDDVPDGNVHEFAIDCVVWWEVAQGTGPNQYSPNAAVNRAQMASFIARVIEKTSYTLPSNPPDRFEDDEGSVHEHRINQLAEVGVVSGKSASRYAPAEDVTRAQMATFLVRAYEVSTGTTLNASQDHFSDDNGSPHEPNINKSAEAGFASGISDTQYAPTQPVRRDQMGSFLARVLDHMTENGYSSPPEGGNGQQPEPPPSPSPSPTSSCASSEGC